MFESLPSGLFNDHHSPVGLGNGLVQIGSVADELIDDVRSLRRENPIVICGKVAPEEPSEYDKELVAALAGNRLAFTFGYELIIDIKWAARIGRDGSLTDVPDLVGSNKSVRSTRHVFRKTAAEEEVILLCNPAGTALAVASEIP